MAFVYKNIYETLPSRKQMTLFVSGSKDTLAMKEIIESIVYSTVNNHIQKHYGLIFDVWIGEKRLEGGLSQQTDELKKAYLEPLQKSHFVVFVSHTNIGPGTFNEVNEACTMIDKSILPRDFLYAYINKRHENESTIKDFKKIIQDKLFWIVYGSDAHLDDITSFELIVNQKLPTWLYDQVAKIPGKVHNPAQHNYPEAAVGNN